MAILFRGSVAPVNVSKTVSDCRAIVMPRCWAAPRADCIGRGFHGVLHLT